MARLNVVPKLEVMVPYLMDGTVARHDGTTGIFLSTLSNAGAGPQRKTHGEHTAEWLITFGQMLKRRYV